MRKSFVALLLLLGAVASMANLAMAQSVEDLRGDLANKLVNARQAAERSAHAARQSPARINDQVDSVWVGHSIQVTTGDFHTFKYGPFYVGRGLNHPGYADAASLSGIWDWDRFNLTAAQYAAIGYPESDSLMGWWPMRRVYSITGGLSLEDTDRPWWAVDFGNQGNYVLPSTQGRTRGVISYWHVDGGNVAAQVKIPGTNALPMTWAPLAGNASAWCGLRAHGDITYTDPLTQNNPYNAMVLEFNGETGGGTGSGVGTSKKYPGYPSQMDQMMYRDVIVTANATLDLSFLYKTVMSTQATSTIATRTGWFNFDPTNVGKVPSSTDPHPIPGDYNKGIDNFIHNDGTGQPADSFMVYIGAPVNVDHVYTADGILHLGVGPAHGVYDLKRRWFSEVLRLDAPIVELLHVAGNNNTSFQALGTSVASIVAAQSGGGNKYCRVVFRVKTNRGFDDNTGSNAGTFSSGGAGAALVDNVVIGGSGVSGGAVGTSAFENVTDIDNTEQVDHLATGKWHTTGKPPAVFFHTHPIGQFGSTDIGGGNLYSSLSFNDICGPPSSTARFCNENGVVISAGDHDNLEAAGGLTAGKPERESMHGIVSPTINLMSTGIGDYNAMGIDADDADVLDDYYVWYDLYAGVFNLFFTGNAWTFGFQSYPATQSDLVKCWGEIRIPGFQIFNPDVQCFSDVEAAYGNGLIKSSNTGNIPDSIRIFLGKNQQCFRFGVTGSACSSTGGAYFDNVSFLMSDATAASGGGAMSMDIWRFINDSFPVNGPDITTLGVPIPPVGYLVAPGTANFDTTTAYIKTGINIAQSPGTSDRATIPGDSMIVIADLDVGSGSRVDMCFRIKPGPGNYHTIGDPNSGLRPVPQDPTNIVTQVANAAFVTSGNPVTDFWAAYLSNPGDASKGVHGPGNFWNKNVWNAARIDTADVNIFPVQSNTGVFDVNVNFGGTANWMATYHESDPKYNVLGLLHNRCFLNNAAGSVNATNISCTGPAGPTVYGAAQGYDGVLQTKEGTKIIPDGLLTPGSHVEYFLRGQSGTVLNPLAFEMVPETTFVNPQNNESSTDGHRWQEFGVLPDRWKEAAFGGSGMACMLYVDLNDRRGDERAWVSVSDSIGATKATDRGNHNGWHANCNACMTDLVGDAIDISGDPTIARYDHGGGAGTTWDMYGVKASESLTTSAGSLGSRTGFQPGFLAIGHQSRNGPTPDMLRGYYSTIMILTGDLNSGIFGKFINRGADDSNLLLNYMTVPTPDAAATAKRALWVEGDGFIQSEYQTGTAGGFPEHIDVLNDLGVTIKIGGGQPIYSYQPWSGNTNNYADVITSGPITGNLYRVGNACLWGNDVLDVVTTGVPSAYYENFGSNGPYIAGVYTARNNPSKIYESYVDGWDVRHLFDHVATSSMGRIDYMWKVLIQIKAETGCKVYGTSLIPLDVPGTNNGQVFTDFVSLRNNPLISGAAKVHFGLSRADRVTARVYDVSGRLVRTLADRSYNAGEYDLLWDGTDDNGRQMDRGVYFTQVKFARNHFSEAKKLTVLK